MFIILLAVLLVAKAPFYLFVVTIAIDIALQVYMYELWLPPQEAAWEREQRRRSYFPQPKKKRRR